MTTGTQTPLKNRRRRRKATTISLIAGLATVAAWVALLWKIEYDLGTTTDYVPGNIMLPPRPITIVLFGVFVAIAVVLLVSLILTRRNRRLNAASTLLWVSTWLGWTLLITSCFSVIMSTIFLGDDPAGIGTFSDFDGILTRVVSAILVVAIIVTVLAGFIMIWTQQETQPTPGHATTEEVAPDKPAQAAESSSGWFQRFRTASDVFITVAVVAVAFLISLAIVTPAFEAYA